MALAWTFLPNFATLTPVQSSRIMEEYMTVPEVAELLKLSEKSVYRLAQKKELPGFKVGGSWRFRRGDIDRWIAKQIKDQKES